MLSTLIGEYKGVLRFFKAYKRFWLTFTAVVLVLSVVACALMLNFFNKNSDALLEAINSVGEVFEGKSDIITDESGKISALGLFKNNVMAMFLVSLLGILPFIFASAFSLMVNIIIICITMTGGIALGAFDVWGAFLLIAPHGIFEIPALLVSSGLDIILCHYVSSKLISHGENPPLASNLLALEFLRTLILVVVPLLLMASVAEAYLTPALFSLFM